MLERLQLGRPWKMFALGFASACLLVLVGLQYVNELEGRGTTRSDDATFVSPGVASGTITDFSLDSAKNTATFKLKPLVDQPSGTQSDTVYDIQTSSTIRSLVGASGEGTTLTFQDLKNGMAVLVNFNMQADERNVVTILDVLPIVEGEQK